jgi:hypothetical protein
MTVLETANSRSPTTGASGRVNNAQSMIHEADSVRRRAGSCGLAVADRCRLQVAAVGDTERARMVTIRM